MIKLKDRVFLKDMSKELGVPQSTIRGWKFHGRYAGELTFKMDLSGRTYCNRREVDKFKRDRL